MSSSNPRVSIVIPYCNRPLHLDRVLRAYETNSYHDLDVLVVYDASCSVKELERVTNGRDVRCFGIPWRHSYGRRALCRNIGAARAQGEIIVFNDVDVIPECEAVERMVKVHSEKRGLILCGRIWRIEGGLEAIRSIEGNKGDELKAVSTPMEYDPLLQWSTIGAIRKTDCWWSFITTFCSFGRRDFLALTGFDPDYFGWGAEDIDLGYRVLKHGMSMLFFEDIVGFHMDHPEDELKKIMALRNLDYFIQKFPELKSFPLLVRQRRDRQEATGGHATFPHDPLLARSHYLGFRRLLAHPVLYARILHRKRAPREGSIAVVIPAKNRAKYLEEAVLSSVYQTRPPQEVYIVIDPSEDSTEALAERLSRRFNEVQCIINDKNRGVAESRNQGIVASASNYVMFLDSDDVLNPWYLEKVAAILDQDEEAGVAYSNYVEFGDRNRVINLPNFDPRLLLVDCVVMGPAMARRRALEQVGGYDAEQVFEDWELWIRVTEKGWRAKGVKEPLYNYRVHKGNRDLESNKKRKEGERLIYQEHRELYERYGVARTTEGTWVNPPIYPPFR